MPGAFFCFKISKIPLGKRPALAVSYTHLSIMGLFSLDLSHPVKVEVHGSDADRSAFEQSVAAFEVKQTQ